MSGKKGKSERIPVSAGQCLNRWRRIRIRGPSQPLPGQRAHKSVTCGNNTAIETLKKRCPRGAGLDSENRPMQTGERVPVLHAQPVGILLLPSPPPHLPVNARIRGPPSRRNSCSRCIERRRKEGRGDVSALRKVRSIHGDHASHKRVPVGRCRS